MTTILQQPARITDFYNDGEYLQERDVAYVTEEDLNAFEKIDHSTVRRRRNAKRPTSLRGQSWVSYERSSFSRSCDSPSYRHEKVRPAVLVVMSIFLGALAFVCLLQFESGSTPSIPSETTSVSVVQGDTLTGIARRSVPGGNEGAVVERIKELNGLSGSTITPGQVLTVPDGRD